MNLQAYLQELVKLFKIKEIFLDSISDKSAFQRRGQHVQLTNYCALLE